ncbi:uncharacterized protein LOC142344159 [Convolutriloba macropyga]|uniref:uncharacterized protein LOC142344159 n=1 Tax=Convolutriloba macropyga TaxID=536237 RepID=UPI003F52080F
MPAGIYIATALSATVSTARSVYNLYQLLKKRVENRGKDFDIYYIPLFIFNFYGSLAFWRIVLRGDEEDSSGALNAKCYPSVLIFVSSTIGACYLQIAINWLEVAVNGKQLVLDVKHKKVLSFFVFISTVEMGVSFAINKLFPNYAMQCEYGQMLPMNSILVWKSMTFFFASFVVFVICIGCGYCTRSDVMREQTCMPTDPAIVNIMKDFTPLVTECAIGATICGLQLLKRFSLLVTEDPQIIENMNYLSFIAIFVVHSCYRF